MPPERLGYQKMYFSIFQFSGTVRFKVVFRAVTDSGYRRDCLNFSPVSSSRYDSFMMNQPRSTLVSWWLSKYGLLGKVKFNVARLSESELLDHSTISNCKPYSPLLMFNSNNYTGNQASSYLPDHNIFSLPSPHCLIHHQKPLLPPKVQTDYMPSAK